MQQNMPAFPPLCLLTLGFPYDPPPRTEPLPNWALESYSHPHTSTPFTADSSQFTLQPLKSKSSSQCSAPSPSGEDSSEWNRYRVMGLGKEGFTLEQQEKLLQLRRKNEDKMNTRKGPEHSCSLCNLSLSSNLTRNPSDCINHTQTLRTCSGTLFLITMNIPSYKFHIQLREINWLFLQFFTTAHFISSYQIYVLCPTSILLSCLSFLLGLQMSKYFPVPTCAKYSSVWAET